MYVGRFAPSPTGPLHFGSLVAALASWLDARAARRALAGAHRGSGRAARTAGRGRLTSCARCERLGLAWDGPVSTRASAHALYEAALQIVCQDTPTGAAARGARSRIRRSRLAADGAQIYPGTCRAGLPPGKAPRAAARAHGGRADRVQRPRAGPRRPQSLEREVGDFVLDRADGQFAYQLAVVVDDAEQGVTDVVRGADLLDSTARQIHLQRLLGYADAALPARAGRR